MKKETDFYCHLCQKFLSEAGFITHLSPEHFPSSSFLCGKCNIECSSATSLQDHVNSYHPSEVDKFGFKEQSYFANVFRNCNDVLRHASKCSTWVRYAFSFGFEDIPSRKEIRSRIRDCFNEGKKETVETNSICKFCDDEENIVIYCCYCTSGLNSTCNLKTHLLSRHLLLPNSIKKLVRLCDICEKVFPSDKCLSQHKKREHRGLQAKKEKTSPFCHYCGKSLANKSNLRRHVLNQHSEEAGATPNNSLFTCDYCKCCFSNKSSVKRHIENLHMREKDTRKSISCFQCEQRFNSIKNLNAHLTIEHNVTINETKLQFSNLMEFWDWKKEEEIRTNARFIQLRGLRRQRRKGEEISTLKFVCNRSGIFHSKSNGKRAYRIKGSSKIGRYCSAYIEITFKENALVDGTYCSTHSGHDNDLRYLTLTMDEKREIYEKIKSGASFSAILNEIRNSVGKEIKRKHLVTNKDLHNIVTTFKKLSKPMNQSITEQFSSDNLNEPAECHQDRIEGAFSDDLDICADLWVETCQRMINRFDVDQSKISAIEFPKDDVVKTSNLKNELNNMQLQTDSRLKHTRATNTANDFVRNVYNSSVEYAPSDLPIANSNPIWPRSNVPLYGVVQETDSRLNMLETSYFCTVPARTATVTDVRRDLPDFCNVNAMANELRTQREFYTADSSVTRSSVTDMKMLDACSSTFNVVNTTNRDTCDPFIRNMNMFDRIPSAENIVSAADTFNNAFVLSEAQQSICEEISSSPVDEVDDNVCDAASENGTLERPSSPSENKDCNEVSDLRDRVNSVTALYNIVESELDERKKKIIRNYVDNMFRVLQYRYNKCKTKKKQTAGKRNPHFISHKKLGRNRQLKNGNSGKPKKNSKQKEKPSNQKLVSQFCLNAGSSKNVNSYQSSLSDPVIEMRSDVNMMRWDQY